MGIRDSPGSPLIQASVREAGCGLCCLAMAVDRLTDKSISLKRLVSLSVRHKANLLPGTDMEILGPVVASQFNLGYSTTESVHTAIRCLKRGGCVIANVGGDREGYTGVFAHEGHFILLIASADNQICVLDPALRPGRDVYKRQAFTISLAVSIRNALIIGLSASCFKRLI